ncbi:MAG: hypothetical protein E6J90_51805 [Deltaproteobacteria bacterium]|nr:MAG: hypothetical protein E6J90_51805 [Deltaproteobacteria bacterium]
MTAADVAGAPVAGDESGRTDPVDDDSVARQGLRGALFVPKVAVNLALSPARLSAWAYDRYHLDELYYRVFFNDARTIGVIPSASFTSGFGINAGARFVDRDLFGAREQLSIAAGIGGRYQQVYKVAVQSGDRLGRVAVELDGQYELRPKDPFYGIGDNDDSAMPAAPVDPRFDPTAIETRYRERLARAAGIVAVQLVGDLHLRSASELTDRTFSPSDTRDGTPIDTVYDPAMLVGYGGVRYVYSELELRFDDRRRATQYEPRPFYSVGSLAAVFGGRIHRLDGAPDYWRYGADLQHFVRIGEGPRVVALRLRGEAVSGTRSEVPFTELPQLGGVDDLRGYPTDRFRDRVLTLGTIEYSWDLSPLLSASAFVDTGRVFGSLDDFGFGHLRVGYGVALQAHTENSFGFQSSLSSSIDGGLFLNLSFNPVFAIDERVRRR